MGANVKALPIESTQANDDRGGRESANWWDLTEALSLAMVTRGDTRAVESAIEWNGAILPEFKILEANGFRKWRARVEWNTGTKHARVVEIHFWTDGTVRTHFKIKG